MDHEAEEKAEKAAERREKWHHFWHHMKHHFMTVSFIFGFFLDNLMLNRIDQPIDQLLLGWYVVLAFLSTWFLYAGTTHRVPEWSLKLVRTWAPIFMQYAFGSLLSGMLIFYGRAGAWDVSWPFMFVILGAIVGNETINDRTTRLIYNLILLNIGLYSYVAQAIPVFTGFMGPVVFVISCVVSLVLMIGFLRLLRLVIPNFLRMHHRAIIMTVSLTFIAFNALYFTNAIPPIPLTLKEIGIYHSVVRFGDGEYQVRGEERPWWSFLLSRGLTIHPLPGEDIFCFAKIYTPMTLNTDIAHVWEYKDPKTGAWQERDKIIYHIKPGNLSGYRGYTLISNYQNGTWRCSVETPRGQVLGRQTFKVDTTTPPGEMYTTLR